MKLLFLLGISIPFLYSVDIAYHKTNFNSSVSTVTYPKGKIDAFNVLKSKCNVCHVKRNRSKIFTLENMDGFSPKIYEQVFVKLRMPKGKTISLSEEDRIKLKNWLATLK